MLSLSQFNDRKKGLVGPYLYKNCGENILFHFSSHVLSGKILFLKKLKL